MAAGYNLDQTGDVGYFEDITLGPDGESRWWFRWDFDDRHWQRMSFVPMGRGVVTIVSEWVAPMRDVVRPKIEAAAAEEGKKLGYTMRDCAKEK